MREIKFRAFDVNENMTYFELNPETLLKGVKDLKSIIKQEEGYHLMQYTGLKDKNGVEVYEGDVVRVLYTGWISKSENDKRSLEQYLTDISYIGTVIFYADRFCIQYEYSNKDSIIVGEYGRIEVIGNIFQNPELLEAFK